MKGVNTIMEEDQLKLTLKRLAHELIENHYPFTDTCIIGIQPRGIAISDFITQYIQTIHPEASIHYGKLDITFYRDDFRGQIHIPSITDLPFSIEGKKVILIDGTLYWPNHQGSNGCLVRQWPRPESGTVYFGRPQVQQRTPDST